MNEEGRESEMGIGLVWEPYIDGDDGFGGYNSIYIFAGFINKY